MCLTSSNYIGVDAYFMMFSREDFRIESVEDFLHFVPIVVFLALVAPFLIAAYTVGFVMDVTGWLASD